MGKNIRNILKGIPIFFVTIMIATYVFTEGAVLTQTAMSQQGSWDKQLLWQSGALGGAPYSAAVGISTIAASAIPDISFTVQTTAGIYDSLKRMSRGTGNAGFAQPDHLVQLQKGEEEFAIATVKKIWTAFPLQKFPFFFISIEDVGLTYLDELTKPGTKVSMNLPNSTAAVTIGTIMKFLGIFDRVTKVNMAHREAAEELMVGRLHAHALGGFSPAFSELALRKKIVAIVPRPKDLERILKEFPYFRETIFETGKYYRGAKTVTTYGNTIMSVMTSDVPDDVVYRLTKGVWENRKTMEGAMAAWAEIQPKDMVGFEYPMHPGAAKYYRETGLNIPEGLIGKR